MLAIFKAIEEAAYFRGESLNRSVAELARSLVGDPLVCLNHVSGHADSVCGSW